MDKILTKEIPLEFFMKAALESHLVDPTIAVTTQDFHEHSEQMALISTILLECNYRNVEVPQTFQNIIEDHMKLIRFKREIYRLMSEKKNNTSK